MAVNTALMKWGIKRLVSGRRADIFDLATRRWEISPAETINSPPAVYLEDALDHVVSLSPWRDWDSERPFLEGGPTVHAASEAFLIENAEISGAFLYCGSAKEHPGYGPQHLTGGGAGPSVSLDEAHLVSNWASSNFFGLFMRASLPLEMLPAKDHQVIQMRTKTYGHEEGYRDLLSMPRPQEITRGRIKRLTIYKDFAHNASKVERYAELRRRLRANLPDAGAAPPPGVYLKRGATGEQRVVTNEAEVEAALAALGFDVVEPAGLSPEEISRRCLNTPIVVSVEGSQLGHAIYSIADNGAFLVLQPPDRFAMAFKEFTDRRNITFAFTVGRPAQGGFRIDVDDLLRTLDLIS